MLNLGYRVIILDDADGSVDQLMYGEPQLLHGRNKKEVIGMTVLNILSCCTEF